MMGERKRGTLRGDSISKEKSEGDGCTELYGTSGFDLDRTTLKSHPIKFGAGAHLS